MATRLNVRVNRKRPESMTRQIREQINDLIEAGELAAGALLPSERELANSLKVARNVVRGYSGMIGGKITSPVPRTVAKILRTAGCRAAIHIMACVAAELPGGASLCETFIVI